MGPFNPQEVEMFAALQWITEQEEKYGAAGLDALRRATELAAW